MANRSDAAPGAPPGRDVLELLGMILLAVAAIATAWSRFQATRWNGEQARAAGRTNALRIEAARAAGQANAQTGIDVATFIQWLNADRTGDADLAQIYRARFRPEFRPAFDAWVATNPFDDPG